MNFRLPNFINKNCTIYLKYTRVQYPVALGLGLDYQAKKHILDWDIAYCTLYSLLLYFTFFKYSTLYSLNIVLCTPYSYKYCILYSL